MKLEFDQWAKPLVLVAYDLEIDAVPLDDFIRTGNPGLVSGAIGVLRLVQVAAMKARIDRQPAPDSASESQPAAPVSGKPAHRPSDNAFRAYWVRELLNISSQTEIARKMVEQGVKATQGQVSKWLAAVDAWHKAGGVIPDVQSLSAPAQSIDPAVIDMGARQDGLTPRQRHRRDPDADE